MTIELIGVFGSGTMGRGIAHVAALAGYDTTIFDLDAAQLESAQQSIAAAMRKGVERGKLTKEAADEALGRIRTSADLETVARESNLIIEAIPEDLQLKKDFFSQIDLYSPEDAIYASNTSSLSITELAGSVEYRERFVGMHFFNPPHLMKLVEIVFGDRTSKETIDAVQEVAHRMGKETIVVRDMPGFATSRLGIALSIEAMRMLEEGVASAEDIDRAMELGFNHPMGPLRLADLVGLDVQLSVATYLAEHLGSRFEPPMILRSLVAEKKLGRKSGRGFYEWSE